MTRAAIYTRVSSSGQLDGYSLDAQLDLCRKLCADRGYEVVAEYVERGESAATTRRTQFTRMMADAKAGAFGVIVTHKLDRLSRSLTDVVLTMRDLRATNVSYVSVSEAFDFTTPVGMRTPLDMPKQLFYYYVR